VKSYKSFMFLILLLPILFLLGCRNGDNQTEGVYYDLIASEKSFPANFYELAFERKEAPHFRYLVRKVINQSEFVDTWNLFRFENKYPEVDFNKNNVFFIGVEESGSCPYKFAKIELSPDQKTMRIPLSKNDGVCTDDATPRAFAIKIDKEISDTIETVVIEQSEVETSIPIRD